MEIGDRKFDNLQGKTEEHLEDMKRAEKEGTFHLFVDPYRPGGPMDLSLLSKTNNNGRSVKYKKHKHRYTLIILSGCALGLAYWKRNEFSEHLNELNEQISEIILMWYYNVVLSNEPNSQ